MTRHLSVLLLAVLTSCSPMQAEPDAGPPDAGSEDSGRPDPQENYTYAGCDDAGTSGCPRSLVFVCALNAIRARHATCQTAADCVVVSATNCFGHLTTCPPAAVNDANAATFLTEANAEGARYCDGGGCRSSPSCAASYQLQRVDCVAGKCVALSDDGGP
jgi:hypothetical protein